MEKERCQEPAGNRRMFLKAVGSIGLGTAALSSEATASPESKGDLGVKKGDNIKERIRESDPQKLYDYYANKYSPEIAKKFAKSGNVIRKQFLMANSVWMSRKRKHLTN